MGGDASDSRPRTILDEAAALTSADRNRDYGSPLANHGNTADHWRLWILRKYGLDVPFEAEDVCWMNVLQKVSREAHRKKRDNKVDVAGYVRNVEMIEDERGRIAGGTAETKRGLPSRQAAPRPRPVRVVLPG